MYKIFTMVIILFILSGTLMGEGVYFMRTPAVSPDAKTIVFSYEKDLWMVASSGGTAYRLTGMDGIETNPRFSPDGKWIAFTGTQDGNGNVYVMPAEGGEIKQLTFHDAGDVVDSWSWDSKWIYFNSSRYNMFSEYKVNLEGGTPIRLVGNYFNTIHGVVEHPVTGAWFFNDTWESIIFPTRKGYKGDFNPDIKSYDSKTKEFKCYTTYRGKDLFPVFDKKGTLYFVSDRYNGEYNLYRLEGEKKVRLTAFDTAVLNPSVSANGQMVAFIKDYQLFAYDVTAGEARQVKVKLFRNDTLNLEQEFDISGKITAFDVSPDGKKMAFVSRGELFISDMEGKFIRQLKTAVSGKVEEVKWFADSKRILFNQTVDGWQNIFSIRSDVSEPAKQLTQDKVNNRNFTLDSKRKQAVYISGTRKVMVMDMETGKSKMVVDDELWSFNSIPYFSPDDRYIAFTAYRNFEQDILVHDLQTGKNLNLTDTGLSEFNPFWSSDGKYLYFAADRQLPQYPRGGKGAHVYRLPLYKFTKPFKSAKVDELFAEKPAEKPAKGTDKKEEKKKEDSVKVTIDLNEMLSRWERVSPRTGRQEIPFVIDKKEDSYVVYASNHDSQNYNLWVTTYKPFEAPTTKKIKGAETNDVDIVVVKDKYYALVKGKIGQLNLSNQSFKPLNMTFNFRRNLRDEFNQMFYELWAGVQENFYDLKFHGVDWLKVRNRYSRFLPYVMSRSDLRMMITDMLGELNSSHLGFYSAGKEEKTFHRMRSMAPGVVFDNDDPLVIKEVVLDSPADKKDVDIRPGDRLLAVNGVSIDPKKNREWYFHAPAADNELELKLKRDQKTFTVRLHPTSTYGFMTNLYDDWIRTNQEYVDKKSDKRIAYVYMKNMGTTALKEFIIEMTSEWYKRDALILDLRYNTGGNVHDDVLSFLSRKPYSYWKYRTGSYADQPHFAPAAKPIVLLINAQTLSDGEVISNGFKALKLGTIIGTETYRWIIFTGGKRLVDGSAYRLPSWGCFTLDKQDLERTGVKPDIYIQNTLPDRLQGKDPQLDAAIEEIFKQLKKK